MTAYPSIKFMEGWPIHSLRRPPSRIVLQGFGPWYRICSPVTGLSETVGGYCSHRDDDAPTPHRMLRQLVCLCDLRKRNSFPDFESRPPSPKGVV